MMYLLLYPFASNLLLIGIIPLYDGTDEKVPQLSSSRGYDKGICWTILMGEWLEVPSTHALGFKSEQEGVHWQWITKTHTNRDFWEAGAAILTHETCAKHTDLMMEVQ